MHCPLENGALSTEQAAQPINKQMDRVNLVAKNIVRKAKEGKSNQPPYLAILAVKNTPT